jgi:hypothetical protein
MSHRTVLPNWDKETQIRIWPRPNENGGFCCMREGSSDNDFSEAVWSEPIARSLGVKEQFTYIDRIPGVTGKTPTSRLVEAVCSLIDEKPRDVPESWIGWTKGGKNRAPKVKAPARHILWQGMEIMRKGTLLTNASGQLQPQFPCLIVGSTSLQMSFEQLGNKQTPGFQGPMPETIQGSDEAARQQRDAAFAQMFEIGDWCSLEHGCIMSIFQAPPSGAFERPHYAIKMVQELPLTSIASVIQQQWTPWDKLLKYFTAEEHVQMLCRAFPPEAVDYAFGTTELRDLMPNTYKDAWKKYRASQTAWTPGMGQPGALPQFAASPAQTGAPAPQQPQMAPQQPQMAPQQPQMAPQQPQFAPTGAPAGQAPVMAPQPQLQQPQQPQQTQSGGQAAPVSSAGGMSVDLSGSAVEGPQDESAIMHTEGFAQTPAEFSQPAGSAPVQPAAAAPAAASQPVQPAQGTPAAAAPAVDQAQLLEMLAQLKAARDQSSQGNS